MATALSLLGKNNFGWEDDISEILLVLPSNYGDSNHFWAFCWHTMVQTLLSFLDTTLSSTVSLILFPLCLYYYSLIPSVRLLKHKLHQFIPHSNSSYVPNQSKSHLSQWSTRLYRVWPNPLTFWLYFFFLIALSSAILNSPGANQDLSHWPLCLPEIPLA